MRISDWSSDVCSSDLISPIPRVSALWSAMPHRRRISPAGTLSHGPWRWKSVKVGAWARRRIIFTFTWTILTRSEERRVGKSVSVRVDLGGRRIIKKKKKKITDIQTQEI